LIVLIILTIKFCTKLKLFIDKIIFINSGF
jgi:hypothetical protein